MTAAAKDVLGTFIAEFDEADLACHMVENASDGEFQRPA